MRVVCWDLETTDLKALIGNILCASFCDAHTGETWTLRLDEKRFRNKRFPHDDSKLVVAIRDTIEKYNLHVAHNGLTYDGPFLNARLLKAGERPLAKRFFIDTKFYMGGVSLRIGGRSLKVAQQFFTTNDSKTDIEWETWNRAKVLDKDAMDTVVGHCEADVKVLREVYWGILPMFRQVQYR